MQKINFQALETINLVSVKSKKFDITAFVKEVATIPTWILVTGTIILLAPLMAMTLFVDNRLFLVITFWVLAIFIGPIFRKFMSAQHLKHWKDFTKDNQWVYRTGGFRDALPTPPLLKTTKTNDKIIFSIEGSYNQMNFILYQTKSLQPTAEVGEYTPWLVVAAKIPPLTKLLIIGAQQPNYSSITQSLEKITLEGDFSKSFKVYMQPGAQIEALTVLTPDVMAQMLDYQGYSYIETSEDYLYTVVKIENTILNNSATNVVQSMFESTYILWDQITEKARRYGQF